MSHSHQRLRGYSLFLPKDRSITKFSAYWSLSVVGVCAYTVSVCVCVLLGIQSTLDGPTLNLSLLKKRRMPMMTHQAAALLFFFFSF